MIILFLSPVPSLLAPTVTWSIGMKMERFVVIEWNSIAVISWWSCNMTALWSLGYTVKSALLWRSAFSNFPDLHSNCWVRSVGYQGNCPTLRHYNAYMWLYGCYLLHQISITFSFNDIASISCCIWWDSGYILWGRADVSWQSHPRL